MKTFFPTQRRTVLIGGITNLVMLCILMLLAIGPCYVQAQMADNQQDSFSLFCNFYYHTEKNSNADANIKTCSDQSSAFLSLLKRETSSDNYTKWPQQLSLNDIAMAGQLTNPQTEAPIKTLQDFQTAIPADDKDLLTLLQKDSAFLPALWGYNSTYNSLSPCGTPTSDAGTPSSNCPNQVPSCSINSQSFQYSDIWPTVGPTFLTRMSQELQDQKGQPIGIYDLYGRLLLKGHCSIATLAQTLKLNGQSIQLNQAYLLERDALIQAAIDNVSNTPLLLALVSTVTQNNYQQLDNWFSAAILSNPIASNAQPIPSASPTPNSQPTSSPSDSNAQSTPSTSPVPNPQLTPGNIFVASSTKQSPSEVNIIKKGENYIVDPPILIVRKGTTVEWKNQSDMDQIIKSGNNTPFALPSRKPNQTSQMQFNILGLFPYHLGDNPFRAGLVIVTP